MRITRLLALAVAAALPLSAFAGNGAPSGSHYNLNIIGVPKGKKADMTGNNGHRIFVPLNGSTKINLTEGEFQVLDANGTDGSAAFQLPVADTDVDTCVQDGTNPDGSPIYVCGSGTTTYSVFVRGLGGSGSAAMTLCGEDPADGSTVCSNSTLEISSGSRKFTNVTGYLLYLYNVDLDGDGDIDYKRIPLFSDVLMNYFWNYDNNGLRIAQLRFYPCSTTVGTDNPEVVDTACVATGNGN
jgi:hypothetical protein